MNIKNAKNTLMLLTLLGPLMLVGSAQFESGFGTPKSQSSVITVFPKQQMTACAASSAAAPQTATLKALALGTAQQKDYKECAAHSTKLVTKMVRFNRLGEQHRYEVPVEFDETDSQTKTTGTRAKIAASLWAGVQRNLSIAGRVRCVGTFCSRACTEKLEAEECDITIDQLHPKTVPVMVTVYESYHTIRKFRFKYDLHDPDVVKVEYVSTFSPRMPDNALPKSILKEIKKNLKVYFDKIERLTVVDDLGIHRWCTPKHVTIGITDLSAPIEQQVCMSGKAKTQITLWSPKLLCKVKPNNPPCEFVYTLDTNLEKASTETQQAKAKEFALSNIKKGNAACICCYNNTADLAHLTEDLQVTISFPKTKKSCFEGCCE